MNNVIRDKIKAEKSKKNHIKLVYWNYDETIDFDTMQNKIKYAQIPMNLCDLS